jgi:hypothetical protein
VAVNKKGTREELAALLTERGYKIAFQTLTQLCMPSNPQGPPVAFYWGRRPIYDFDEGLEWARRRAEASTQARELRKRHQAFAA